MMFTVTGYSPREFVGTDMCPVGGCTGRVKPKTNAHLLHSSAKEKIRCVVLKGTEQRPQQVFVFADRNQSGVVADEAGVSFSGNRYRRSSFAKRVFFFCRHMQMWYDVFIVGLDGVRRESAVNSLQPNVDTMVIYKYLPSTTQPFASARHSSNHGNRYRYLLRG